MTLTGLGAPLGLLLLGLLGALVLGLHLLRPSPPQLPTASTLIWSRVLRNRRRASRRYRWWLSLLLALAISLGLGLSLGLPEFTALSGPAQRLALVLDDSPSMGARTADGRTRFDHAVDRARNLIEGAPGGSRFLVADTLGQVALPALGGREAALDALRRVRPSLAGDAQMPVLAGRAAEPLEVVLLTDGVARLDAGPGVRRVSVFEPAANAGITAFALRAQPAQPGHVEAFVEVLNDSTLARASELRLSGVRGEHWSRRLHLAPGERAGVVADLSAFSEGPVRAALVGGSDALAADDTAVGWVPAHGRLRVGWVGPRRGALARALRALPRVSLVALGLGDLEREPAVDVLVLDRQAPARAPRLPCLLLRPPPVTWLPSVGGSLEEVTVAAWDLAHPLGAGVGLHDLWVRGALALRQPAAQGFAPFAGGPAAEPLILVAAQAPRRVEFAFALEDSSLPGQAGFPGLLANALEWLTSPAPVRVARLGPVHVPLPGARVVGPGGETVPVREVPGGTGFDALVPGIYTAVAGTQTWRVVANAADARLSAINQSALQPGQPPPLPGLASVRVEAWEAIVLAVMLLLCAEWFSYHRRVSL